MLRSLLLIAALLRLLARAWTTPHTAVTGASISAADHNSKIRDNLTHLYNNLELRPTRFHNAAKVVTGNAIALVINVGQAHNFFAWQSAAANGDTFKQSLVLGAGTYTLHVLGITGTPGGLLDWYLDDVLIGSGQSWYAASGVANTEKTISNIVVSEGGRHVLKGVVNGTGGGAGYGVRLTCYWFEPASE